MSTGPAIAEFFAGALVSLGTSWVLVARLERVGERLGLSEALLGIMAALAADTPEITSAITALAGHQRSIGAGVVIGSNVFNLAALLGLGALVAGRVGLHRKVVVLGGAAAVWVALVCLGTVGAVLPPLAGLLLALAVLGPYLFVLGADRDRLARLARRGLPERLLAWTASAVDEEELELVSAIRPRRGRPVDVGVAAVALVVVVAASVAMEHGASALGTRYAVAGVVVGALVLAAVTSLPNAVAAVHLARKGRGAAALSTALNSNNLNVVAGLLLPGVVVGLSRASSVGLLVAACYLGLTLVTLALAYAKSGLGRWEGAVIVAGYAGFVASVLVLA